MMGIRESQLIRLTELFHAAIAVTALGVCAAVAPLSLSAGVACGALFGALNFRGLAVVCHALLGSPGTRVSPWLALGWLRMTVLATALALAVALGADPLGLALGLSAPPWACVAAALWLHRADVISAAERAVPR